MKIENLKDIKGKEIIMCPKCKSQVSTLEENTICKKCSDYNYITESYYNLVRHGKFIIDINTMEKQTISNMNFKFIMGIPIIRFKRLIDLFMKAGYDLKNDEHFKFIKRDYFNITKENKK